MQRFPQQQHQSSKSPLMMIIIVTLGWFVVMTVAQQQKLQPRPTRRLFTIENYHVNDLPEGLIENMKYERNDTDLYYHEEWNEMMNEYYMYDDPTDRNVYRQYMMQHFEKRYLTERDLQLLSLNRCQGSNFNNPLRACACTEDEFREQIYSDGSSIRVCFGVRINITKPIDITGKSFRMQCFPWPVPSTCYIGGIRQFALGNRTSQGFVGAPDEIHFNGMVIDDFHAPDNVSDNTAGYGGAFSLTGGTTIFFESQINYCAGSRGAGVYLTGSNTRFESSMGLFMYGNYAYYGGAFYATNNATIALFGSGITNNWAWNNGGGFYLTSGATASIQAIVFYNNTALTDGRDIYINNKTKTTYVNCTSTGPRNNFCDGDTDGIYGSSTSTNCKYVGFNLNTKSPRCKWMYGLVNQ